MNEVSHTQILWFHLYEVTEQAELVMEEKQSSPCLGVRAGTVWEKVWKNFLGNGNDLYLKRALGYTSVCIYQNSLNGTLKTCI